MLDVRIPGHGYRGGPMAGLTVSTRAYALPTRTMAAVWMAVALWSASALTVRAGHADPIAFTTWRLWLALPPLALVVGVRSARGEPLVMRAPGMSRARWALIIAGAGGFFASGAATAFAALGRTRLLDVTLIGALQPVLVIALAVAFLRERTDRATVSWAGVAVGGTVLVASSAAGSGNWSLAGDLIAVLSLFLNVGWFLYGRVVRDRYTVDPFAFMLAVLFAAAVMTTPVALLGGGLDLTRAQIGYATLTMLVGTAAHVLMVWAHRWVPASRSAPLLLAQPPLVAVAAWALFGEALGPFEILGAVVVVAALRAMVASPALEHAERETPDPAPPA